MFRIAKYLPLTAFCIAITATSAKADWQFTKWGMSPTELQQVSPVTLRNGNNCSGRNSNFPDRDYDVKYASDWNVGSISFDVCYFFLDKKLNRVKLTSDNANIDAIIKGLSEKYGSPTINSRMSLVGVIIYNWNLPNEEIEFIWIDSKRKRNIDKDVYIVTYTSKAGTDEILIRDGL